MSTTIKTYRITASFTRDGVCQGSDTAETLGQAYGKVYTDRADAESDAEDMQSELEEYGLDPSTTYTVEET